MTTRDDLSMLLTQLPQGSHIDMAPDVLSSVFHGNEGAAREFAREHNCTVAAISEPGLAGGLRFVREIPAGQSSAAGIDPLVDGEKIKAVNQHEGRAPGSNRMTGFDREEEQRH